VPLVTFLFVRFGGSGNPLTYIDASNEAQLRSVFFSGEVWAVACADKAGGPPDSWESVAARLKESTDTLKFGVLDCTAKLPSGRTILQRWKLNGRDVPTIFVANGVQVSQVSASAARSSEYDLVREIRLAAIRRPVTLVSTLSFQEKCLAKPRCLLVLQGGVELEPSFAKTLDALMGVYANKPDYPVSFAMLDASDWKLDFEGFEAGDAAKLRNYEPGSHRVLYFHNASSSSTKTVAFHRALTETGLASFLDGLADRESKETLDKTLVALEPGSPTLVKRPRPKKKQVPPPRKVDEETKKKTKVPETLTDEERAKIKQERRDRENRARDTMEQQAQGYVPEADDDLEDDDDDAELEDDDDDEEEEEEVEEI